MARCARKSSLKKLHQRRKVFYGKMNDTFSEESREMIEKRMVVIEKQERWEQCLAREANRNMVITR